MISARSWVGVGSGGGGADPDPSALLRRGGILKHTGYKRQGKKSSTKGKDDFASGCYFKDLYENILHRFNKTNILIFHKHHIKEFITTSSLQHQAYNITLHLGYITSGFQKNHYYSTSYRGST